jgi:hypothetical protein
MNEIEEVVRRELRTADLSEDNEAIIGDVRARRAGGFTGEEPGADEEAGDDSKSGEEDRGFENDGKKGWSGLKGTTADVERPIDGGGPELEPEHEERPEGPKGRGAPGKSGVGQSHGGLETVNGVGGVDIEDVVALVTKLLNGPKEGIFAVEGGVEREFFHGSLLGVPA